MSRFTLDEAKAREGIAEAMTNWQTNDHPDHPAIDPDYSPATDYDSGSETANLVHEARGAGILAGPGQLYFDFQSDENDGAGYTWLLYVDGIPGHSLKLASDYAEIRHLGDGPNVSGANAAMAVLREARDAGNRLLDDLSAYVTQEAGR